MDTSLDIMDSECMLKSDLTYVLDTSTNRCADCAAKNTLTATLRLASSTAAYTSARQHGTSATGKGVSRSHHTHLSMLTRMPVRISMLVCCLSGSTMAASTST